MRILIDTNILISAALNFHGTPYKAWPISNQEYEAQNENSEYFNRFKEDVIYKVARRLQYIYFGEL